MSETANKALKRMIRGEEKVLVSTGTVKAVNGYLCDVDPGDGGSTLFDVRLKVAVNDQEKGVFAIPAVGSEVRMLMVNNQPNNIAVIDVETVDHYVIRLAGGAEIVAKNDGTVAINGTQFGGLVKVQALRTDLNKVNALLNGLQNAFDLWAPSDGGQAALKAAVLARFQAFPLPNYNSIESDKTQHGSL